MFPGYASQELGNPGRPGTAARVAGVRMALMGSAGDREEIHRHSGWLIPAGFFLAIVALSGLFLGWYLRPGPMAPAAPTGRSTMVQVMVRGTAFTIPANYMESSAARA